jgi:hypothetical protein
MIGGGILSAWTPFWKFLSFLSTVDFMRTAGGHPSIGTLLLPPGLAGCITVIGIAVMVGAFLSFDRPGSQTDKQSPRSAIPSMDEARFSSVKEQLSRLSRFELFAVWQLLLNEGMSPVRFGDAVRDYGYPIGTQLDLNELRATFSRINENVSLLTYDQAADTWCVKSEFKSCAHFIIGKLSPLFGI